MFLIYFEPGTPSEGAATAETLISATESVSFALRVRASMMDSFDLKGFLTMDQGRGLDA